jgi:hypothetical protein
MADHYHCKGVGCYNRMQFMDTCSRCNGSTTPCDGDCNSPNAGEMLEKLGIRQPVEKMLALTKLETPPTSVDEADKLMEELR